MFYLDKTSLQQFLNRLTILLTKVFVNMRKYENLPTKMIQSIKEVETLLIDEGPLEIKVIVTLGRLGGAADPSTIETEALLSVGFLLGSLGQLRCLPVVLHQSVGKVESGEI